MSRFNKKRQIEQVNGPGLSEWMIRSDFFVDASGPADRMQKLLVDIQKRALAEQVLLISREGDDGSAVLIGLSPIEEPPLIETESQKGILRLVAEERRILDSDFLTKVPAVRNEIQGKELNIRAVPVWVQSDAVDVLILINCSRSNKIADYLSIIGSVLALAIQNVRLSRQFQKKDEELKQWVSHVEQRIEEGTKKLLEREWQYYVLFEGANDGILVHDREGRLLEANKVACRLLGYPKKELLQKKWTDFAPTDHWPDLNRFFQNVILLNKSIPLKTVLRKNNGEVFQAEISSRRIRFKGNHVIQSYVRDVSMQLALEESLRESKEKYRLFIESSLVGVFILREGRIQFVNGMFEKLTGYAKGELLERTLEDLVFSEDREKLRVRLEDPNPQRFEIRLNRKNGSQSWGEVYSRQVLLDNQPAVLGNIVDITEKRELERHFFETQKLESIRTLAGGIAHDFNNLLGGILGYASLLLSDMTPEHPFHEDVQTIAQTAKQAAELTNHLLAFARGGKYQVVTLSMNTIVKEVTGVLAHSIDRTITIETELDNGLWNVKGDYEQIHQAIVNICMNAAEAMPEGGVICIQTSNIALEETFAKSQLGIPPGKYVQISISDTGIGMDENIRSRIFEPFFTTKPAGRGTGMGMALVYGVIKNHGGSIEVHSEVNRGTKVTFFLPVSAEEKSKTEPVQPRPQGGKILLVDDERVIRHVGKRMLEKSGFQVLVAGDGQEALDIYQREGKAIDLVILDLIMPKMDGKDTYEKLCRINPDVKVVFTSGYRQDDRLEFVRIQEDAFIQKPFNTEMLVQSVRRRLEIKNA